MQNDNVVENDVNEVAAELVEQRVQLLRDVAGALRAYPGGGPNLRDKHLAEAKRLGLDVGQIADQWDHVIGQGRRPYANLGIRPLSGPPSPTNPTPANDPGPPKTEVALEVSGKVKRPLAEIMKGADLKKLKEVEEEPEPQLDAHVEPVDPGVDADADAVSIGRALVPVKRFASRIILPDVAQVSQVKETVRLVNLKHQIVGNYGGRCMVVSWERWPVNPKFLVPTFQKVADFTNRYANRFVEQETKSGTQRVPTGTFWFSHSASATFDGVGFRPGEDEVLPGKLLNLWRGWSVEPKKGNWRLLRRHIYLVLGNGDWKAGRYILRWFAHMFQHPGEPGQTVLVFKGEEEGLGKGIMAQAIMHILGPYSLPGTSLVPSVATSNTACSCSWTKRFGLAIRKPRAD